MENVRKEAKITSKGQITVPVAIRRRLGVRPGDRLVFEIAGENVSVRPVRAPVSFEKYRGMGSAELPASRPELAQFMRELRGR